MNPFLRSIQTKTFNGGILGKNWRNACFQSYSQDGGFRPPTSQMPKMTDIGSRSLFSPDQDALRETVRKFFSKEVIPHYSKWEDQGHADKSVWNKAGEYGILGINIPAEHGGIGG